MSDSWRLRVKNPLESSPHIKQNTVFPTKDETEETTLNSYNKTTTRSVDGTEYFHCAINVLAKKETSLQLQRTMNTWKQAVYIIPYSRL